MGLLSVPPKSTGGAKCAICSKPVTPEFRPFCSARCKQVDLNRWLSEAYRVPEGAAEESAEDRRREGDDEEE